MFANPNLAPLSAEIFLLTMACVVMVVDLFQKDKQRRLTLWLSQASLFVTLLLTMQSYGTEKTVLYDGFWVVDNLSIILKSAILIVAMAALAYAPNYINERKFLRGEYYMLAMFAVLGMLVMVSAHNLLVIYLGLELLSLPLYAMVAMERDNPKASEAAIKYFVMGALASGFLLYGMSLLYGATQEIGLQAFADALTKLNEQPLMLKFGVVFIVAGLAFKLGAVPFHMWLPDVYHGAPTSVTLFMGSAPKIAAFGMLMRLLVDGLSSAITEWQPLLLVLAYLSIALGNVVAISQWNLKRMLAYSAISHVGYFLMGIIAGNADGYAASMFYILVYAVMTLASFGIIIFLSRAGFESDRLEDFAGLAKRSPWYAAMTLFTMMSLAGVPPFVGFWPKLEVIMAALNAGYVGLAIHAVVFSLIGAYYYLRVAKVMYFDPPSEETPIEANSGLRLLMSVNGLLMLGLGLVPGWLLAYCLSAFPG
ncbi:MAG: NADH-quinone oxidoreductase subunit NuoN [Gammaproteobacteria bacterium]|nr:MAG: NADH-quinone oxidoreductase subunit NuoN [Gammaproteobacteria bacterium]